MKETEAGVKLAKANRDLAQLNFDWCEVRASTSGRLSRRMVDPGSLVKADSTVLTSIVSLDPIYVYFDVHEQTMLRIKHLMQQGKVSARALRGIPVEISLPDETEGSLPHKGIVDFTDNKVDYSTGTLTFRAKLDNKDHLLNPGLFVRVRLPVGDPHEAVMIRERALVTNHGVKGVYILSDRDEKDQPIKSDPQAKGNSAPSRRAVWKAIGNPGVVRDGFVEVAQGVRPGEWVVVSGMQRLWPDKQVKAEKYAEAAPASERKQDSDSTAAVPKGAHQAARLP
jgi:RND family efflux transporter MFP subunit